MTRVGATSAANPRHREPVRPRYWRSPGLLRGLPRTERRGVQHGLGCPLPVSRWPGRRSTRHPRCHRSARLCDLRRRRQRHRGGLRGSETTWIRDRPPAHRGTLGPTEVLCSRARRNVINITSIRTTTQVELVACPNTSGDVPSPPPRAVPEAGRVLSLANGLAEAQEVPLAVPEPGGALTNASRRVIALHLGDAVHRDKAGNVDLLEHHPTVPQLGNHGHDVIDLPRHLGMAARRHARRLEQREPPAAAPVAQPAGPLLDWLQAELLRVERPRPCQVLRRQAGRHVTVAEHAVNPLLAGPIATLCRDRAADAGSHTPRSSSGRAASWPPPTLRSASSPKAPPRAAGTPDQCAAPCPASRRDGPPGRNLAEWGRHITSSLRNRVQQSPDPSLETFTTELDAYLPGAHPHAEHLGFARAVAAAGTGRRTAPDHHVHIVRDRRRCHTVRAAPRSIPARRRDHGNNPQAAEMISPAKSRRMRCARMCSATSTWLTRALPGCQCTRSAAHWTGSQPSPGAAGTACGRPMSASLRLGRHTQCSPAGRPGRHRPCAGSRSRRARNQDAAPKMPSVPSRRSTATSSPARLWQQR